MKDIQRKPKLIPVLVPWRITSAVPVLSITIIEMNSITVSFQSFLGPINPYTGEIDEEVRLVENEFASLGYRNSPEVRVELTFPFTTDVRINPCISEGRVIDYDLYDTSGLLPALTSDFNRYAQEGFQIWKATGYCPTPRMYSIEPSAWLESLTEQGYQYHLGERPAKHYMILGEDMWIEILAKEWSWKLAQQTD